MNVSAASALSSLELEPAAASAVLSFLSENQYSMTAIEIPVIVQLTIV